MYGYVRIRKPELKIKDYEIYKGVYCSLCRQLGREYGPFARFALNYDFTLLALLHMATEECCPGFKKGRCSFNPLIKCAKCTGGTETLSLAAACAMIMGYFKIRDNIADGTFFRRLAFRALLPYFSLKKRKAKKKFPDVYEQIKSAFDRQEKIEKSSDSSLDMAAEPTAAALKFLAARGEPDAVQRQVLERFGYLIGRWIYIADALDDFEKDRELNSFNPLLGKGRTDEQIRKYAEGLMNVTLGEAVAAYELLRLKRFKDILDNIIFDGMYDTMNSILRKGEKEHE